MVITFSSTNHIRNKEGWQTIAVCDQHSTQCSPSREPVPSLTDLGDSLQVIWEHYHQHNGPQEHRLLHLNQ